MTWSTVVFGVLAVTSVGTALLVVANRNPVRSALWLVLNFFVLAVLYLTLSAQFIAAAQVIVYAGAIMVLFLFTIMLLNLGGADILRESGGLRAAAAVALAGIFLGALALAGSLGGSMGLPEAAPGAIARNGTVEAIGHSLFDPGQPWLFPFEITSVLLLVGIVGSIVLAKRRL